MTKEQIEAELERLREELEDAQDKNQVHKQVTISAQITKLLNELETEAV